jgi:hypothetical protein
LAKIAENSDHNTHTIHLKNDLWDILMQRIVLKIGFGAYKNILVLP